jgi:hypothetical protein
MPRSINARIMSRGFHSPVAYGATGAGALDSQGHPVSSAHGQNVVTTAPSQVLAGFGPEAPPPPEVDILDGAFGLPGAMWEPDLTPLTHSAPVPGWSGSYADAQALSEMHEKSAAIHAKDFGALARHTTLQGVDEPTIDRWTSNEPGESVQSPVSGQLRYMGGRDDVQGYGLRNRYGFDAGHRDRIVATDPQPMAFLDSAERPYIVPQAGVNATFVPTDSVQGPNPDGQFHDAGDINSTPPSAYTPPAEPDTFNGVVASAPASLGWWQ